MNWLFPSFSIFRRRSISQTSRLYFGHLGLFLAANLFASCLIPPANKNDLYNKPFRLVRSTCPSTFTGIHPENQVNYCLNHFSCLGTNVTPTNYTVITLTEASKFQRTVYLANTPIPVLDISFESDVTGWGGRYTAEGSQLQFQRVDPQGNLRCIPSSCSEAVAGYALSGQTNSLKLKLTWPNCQEDYELWTRIEGPL